MVMQKLYLQRVQFCLIANDDHILSLGCLSDLVGLVRLTQEEDIVQVKPSNGQAARSVRV